MNKLHSWVTRHSPPGMELTFERRFTRVGFWVSLLYNLCFFVDYFHARSALYIRENGKRILLTDKTMPDFAELLGSYLWGFAILAVCMSGFVILRYAYYHQGSKSIYLMRRLPHRSERHRRAWLIPLCVVALCVLSALCLLLFEFAIYMLLTPDECRTAGQWEKIWRLSLC